MISAARHASESERVKEVTGGNTFFPVVFIGQDEMEANVRRIRSATEAVLGDAS
jgi:glutaredoxin